MTAHLDEGGAGLVQGDQLLSLHKVGHMSVIVHTPDTEPEAIYSYFEQVLVP